MLSWARATLASLTVVVLMAGCADRPAPSVTQPGSAEPARPKRIVGAVVSDPPFLSYKIVSAAQGGYPGSEALESLVHTGLSTFDREGRLRPVLAEDLPSTDNGQWQVFPDGRMETTWKIRPNAQWHDGAAFTASDLLFTRRVVDDPDLPFFERQPATLIDRIVALDPHTVTVTWKRPFIQADALFSRFMAMPLPSHILERTFDADPATLANLPYFTQEFVGSGPFKLRDWVPGSHIIVQANDAYVLGRPKVDEVEIRFIPDQNTLGANILSGTVEFTIGRGVELETAMQIRDQWADGRMEAAPINWNQMFPQFLNPNPAVVGDVRFRRALLHALNRQEIVDTLQFGLSSVAHSYVHPSEPEFKEIEGNIVKYEYDPRRAAQIIEELGYIRGPDGGFFDGTNRKLTVQLRSSAANQGKMLLTVADYWQAAGVEVEPFMIPRQQATDQEFRANFPAFELTGRSNEMRAIGNLHSSQTPLPENRYTGSNISRYRSAEYDALIDSYLSTISPLARIQIEGKIMHHMTDNVLTLSISYNSEPVLVANRIQNLTPRNVASTHTWNSHEWDVR